MLQENHPGERMTVSRPKCHVEAFGRSELKKKNSPIEQIVMKKTSNFIQRDFRIPKQSLASGIGRGS